MKWLVLLFCVFALTVGKPLECPKTVKDWPRWGQKAPCDPKDNPGE